MPQLTMAELWFLIWGLVLGSIISIFGNAVVATYFRWRDDLTKKTEFLVSALVFLITFGIFLYSFMV